MMQGDSYNLGIRIENNAGNPVTPGDVQDVEITIGELRKTYLGAQVTFDEGTNLWMFPVSQRESLGFRPGSVRAQVRVVWANGSVEGQPLYGVRFHESMSREVL